MTTKNLIHAKHYTIQEANAALPLLRAILRDITDLATDLRQRHERLTRLQERETLDAAHKEEVEQMVVAFQRDQERMREFEQELRNLHVELKDYFSGLVDFPSLMNGREVYLCWRLGEPEVAHWHDLDSGFAGRQKLPRIL